MNKYRFSYGVIAQLLVITARKQGVFVRVFKQRIVIFRVFQKTRAVNLPAKKHVNVFGRIIVRKPEGKIRVKAVKACYPCHAGTGYH